MYWLRLWPTREMGTWCSEWLCDLLTGIMHRYASTGSKAVHYSTNKMCSLVASGADSSLALNSHSLVHEGGPAEGMELGHTWL